MDFQLGDIALAIQLAIAPALLLVGVTTLLRVLANRMARIVDRQRALEQGAGLSGRDETERAILLRRTTLVQRAVMLAALSALLTCLVIAALFLTDIINKPFHRAIAALFVLDMASLILSFIYFLREIFLATATLPLWLRGRAGRQRRR